MSTATPTASVPRTPIAPPPSPPNALATAVSATVDRAVATLPPGLTRSWRAAPAGSWVFDFILAVGVVLITASGTLVVSVLLGAVHDMRHDLATSAVVVAATHVLLGLAFIVRRHAPALMWSLTALTFLSLAMVEPNLISAFLPAALFMVGSFARWSTLPAWVSWLFGVGPFFLLTGLLTWVGDFYGVIGCLTLLVPSVAVVWLGRSLRATSAHIAAHRVEAERRVEAEHHASDMVSRTQVARELHDVVAHSLAVIVVQAEGAAAIAEADPAQSREAVRTIAETARTSLAEMRRIVGVLRDSDGVEFGPAPVLADVPALVTSADPRARLETVGDLTDAHPAVGLAAYRLVQEALTNTMRHGGDGAVATVRVRALAPGVELSVVDAGVGSPTATFSDALADGSPGHGLTGMRERVAALGGVMSAGPEPGGDFGVRAWLPTPEDALR